MSPRLLHTQITEVVWVATYLGFALDHQLGNHAVYCATPDSVAQIRIKRGEPYFQLPPESPMEELLIDGEVPEGLVSLNLPRIVIPMKGGQDIRPKTLAGILDAMGVTPEEFRRLLRE